MTTNLLSHIWAATRPSDLSGDWADLAAPDQRPRYEAIAALVPPRSSVLDVGCGMAVLRGYLPATIFYVGVEPSALARSMAGGRAAIYGVRAEDFRPNVLFDRIVMSECCYYMNDPVAMLRRYAGFLADGGRFVISIYQPANQRPGLRKRLKCLWHRRHPLTNAHCVRMVDAFLARAGWMVHSQQSVARPGGAESWVVWEVGAGKGESNHG